jgi:hypothetical protein
MLIFLEIERGENTQNYLANCQIIKKVYKYKAHKTFFFRDRHIICDTIIININASAHNETLTKDGAEE